MVLDDDDDTTPCSPIVVGRRYLQVTDDFNAGFVGGGTMPRKAAVTDPKR